MSTQTVLLVDELSGSQTAKSALLHSSYRVLTASSGEQALEILQAKAAVELVLSELQMSVGMSGISLAGRIRVDYPDTAVLLMAGAPHPPLDTAIPLLVKPFTPSILINRVQQVLADALRARESLARTFEVNRTRVEELAEAGLSVRRAVQQSRRERAERFRLRLRRACGTPTILVAEDDPALRYSLCRYLAKCGFRVLEASDGSEALQVSRDHGDHIDMLVADSRMPGLSGVELAGTLTDERPRTRVLLMTADGLAVPLPAVRKPFDMDDLLAHIVGALCP